MVGAEITGWDQIVANCEALAVKLHQYNEEATRQNLAKAVELSVLRAPYKTGALRRSISYVITDSSLEKGIVVGQYGSDLPYASIIEVGGLIPAHFVAPKNRKALAWPDPTAPGGMAFSKGHTIKAQFRTAKPYLFPTLIENIEAFLNRYSKAYSDAVSDAIK